MKIITIKFRSAQNVRNVWISKGKLSTEFDVCS